MIYNDKEMTYPSNTIINDAACRSSYTTDAYSPITDEIHNVLEKYKTTRREAYGFLRDPSNIMQSLNYRDFEFDKVKGRTANIEDDGSYITESEIKMFEGNTIQMIVEYFESAWYNWQFKQGMNKEQSMMDTYGGLLYKDNADDDTYVLPDDLEQEDEFIDVYKEEELIFNVQQLVFYLKLLQEMSISKGYSAIQTLILLAKYNGNRSSVAKEGLYKIDSSGNVVGRYAETANTSNSFIKWIDLCECRGTTPDAARWVSVIERFKDVCDRLSIDLRNEDPDDYLPDYVNSQLCTYLASNEEYIDTIGRIDKNMFQLLDPDKLFAVRSASMLFDDQFANAAGIDKVVLKFQEVYDELSVYSEFVSTQTSNKAKALNEKVRQVYDAKEDLVEGLMVNLLFYHLKMGTMEECISFYRQHYYFNNDNLLWFENNDETKPFTIKASTIGTYFRWPGAGEVTCYITISGIFIFFDNQREIPTYVTIEELIDEKSKPEVKNL